MTMGATGYAWPARDFWPGLEAEPLAAVCGRCPGPGRGLLALLALIAFAAAVSS